MNNYRKRQIRIFISSTFEDMAFERSELAKTFRELSVKARSHNVALNAIDLRWGIRPGESVVELCLREIENSHPFFLGIIGDRYGSVPDMEEYTANENLQLKYGNWLEDAIRDGMSYTEIEMQFGAFMEMEKAQRTGNIVFFIKDDAQKTKSPKLESLIKKINDYHGKGLCDLDDYSTVTELSTKVRTYYESVLNNLYPKGQLQEFEIERLTQTTVCGEKSSSYIPYNDYCIKLDDFVNNENSQYQILTGEDGTGKSSLLAYWINQHLNDKAMDIVYSFVGEGLIKYNTESLQHQIYSEIAQKYDSQSTSPHDSVTTKDLAELLAELPMEKPLVIAIDGVSKLYRYGEPVNLLWLPIPIASNVKVIMADVPEDALRHSMISKECLLSITPISEDFDKLKLMDTYLGVYGKKLSDEEKTLLASSALCNNGLILKSILNELIYFGKYDTIDQTIRWFISSPDSSTLFEKILQNYEQNYTEELVRDVLSLIAVSRNGLEEIVIMETLGIRQYQWSQLFCALNLHFSVTNGKVRLAYPPIITAINKRYNSHFEAYRRKIANYYESHIKEDDGTFNADAVLEVTWQYYRLEDAGNLFRHLADFRLLTILFHQDYFNAGTYWRYLENTDNHTYDINIYAHISCEDMALLADFYRELSMFCFETRFNLGAAFTYMELCLQMHTSLFGKVSEEVATDYERLGEISKSKANDSDPIGIALNYYQRAYQIWTELPGDHRFAIVENLMVMSELMRGLDFAEETNDLLNRALNMLNGISSISPSFIARIIENMADKKLDYGHYEEARRYYEDAMRFRENDVPPNHPSIANKYISIGWTYEFEENYPQALEYYQKAENIFVEKFGLEHAACARIKRFIGRVLCKMQRYDEGLKTLDEAIDIWNGRLGEINISTAETLQLKATVYAKMNKTGEPDKEARILTERAINILEEIGGCEDVINSYYQFLADMYRPKYPKIADVYLEKIH